MSLIESQAYLDRVIQRLMKVGGEASPEGIGQNPQFWEEMEAADDMLSAACEAFLKGEIDKEELNQKAIGYLNHWRQLCQTLTNSSPEATSSMTPCKKP